MLFHKKSYKAMTAAIVAVSMILASLFASTAISSEAKSPQYAAQVQLSGEEMTWLKEHPVISVGHSSKHEPILIKRSDDLMVGILPDFFKLAGERLGVTFKIIDDEWHEVIRRTCENEIDIVGQMNRPIALEKGLIAVDSPFVNLVTVFARKDRKFEIRSDTDLNGKRVAYFKKIIFLDQYFNEHGDKIERVEAESPFDAFKNVLEKRADVAVGFNNHSYLLSKFAIPEIEPVYVFQNLKVEGVIAVRPNAPLLAAVLQKAFDSIGYSERNQVLSKWSWIPDAMMNRMSFTQVEKDWLKGNPEIRIGIMDAWPPMDYVDSEGQPRGIGVEFIHAINKRLGNRLKIVPGSWDDIYKAAKQKRIDALMDITPRKDREFFFHFTRPYAQIPHVIFTRKGERYKGALADLSGMSVGVEKGFYIGSVLENKYPDVRVRKYKTTSDALDALSKGDIDAYVGNRAVAMYIIENELISNLKAQGKITETSSVNAIGIRKDWPVLAGILDRAIADIRPEEVREIYRRWSGDSREEKLGLTQEERDWLARNPVVRLGYDRDWPPVEYADKDGRYQGMSAEYIALISEVLGITFTPSPPQSWQETIQAVKSGELDVLSAAMRIPERESYLNFTSPYLSFPMVVVTGFDFSYINDIDTLSGKTIAVVEGYAVENMLKNDYPDLLLLPVKNVAEGLRAVHRDHADAFIDALTSVSYVMGREKIPGLKISGEAPLTIKLSIGTHKDKPILAGLMQKALDTISDEKRSEIFNRWVSVRYERGFDYSMLWKILTPILVIVMVIFYWNRKLKKEVVHRQRTEAELVKAMSELNETMSKLKRLNDELEMRVQKRTAALEKAKKAAEQSNKAKSLFINNMSHELRTPLNGIIVSSDLALGQELSPKMEKIQKRISRSSRSLLRTVNTILDFAKSEDGELELAVTPFRLDEMLGMLSGTFVQKSVQKQVRIGFEIADDKVPNALIGDPERLVDVFNHLLDNAVKFSVKSPEITIGIKEIETSEKKTTLEFHVKDNGIGIASENFEKIFNAFTQVDDSSTRQYDGTGMGLAVSKRLVEGMGGTIRVESEVGKGSIFYFTVTLDRQDHEQPFKLPTLEDPEETEREKKTPDAKKKIGTRELLVELLSTIGPFIQKRKPKQSKEIMAEISEFEWPDEFAAEINELERLIGKYKFKQAIPIWESTLEKLKS